MLIGPVPFKEPSRLVGLFESVALGPRYHLSSLDDVDWKHENKTFSALEAFDSGPAAMTNTAGVEQVEAAVVTAARGRGRLARGWRWERRRVRCID